MRAAGKRTGYGDKRETIEEKCERLHERHLKARLESTLSALKACSSSKDLPLGKKIHSDAIRGGDDSNTFVSNALISMYARCQRRESAAFVFEAMQQTSVVSWNSIMFAYAKSDEPEFALHLFSLATIKDDGTFVAALKACEAAKAGALQLSKAVENTLVYMYARCGSLAEARTVFDSMRRRDLVSWNVLMFAYARCGGPEAELALELFGRMRDECRPDARSYVAALKACATCAAKDKERVRSAWLERGRKIHSLAVEDELDLQLFVGSALVDMYAKCDCLEEARYVFARMRRRDVLCWTAMIQSHAERESERALEIYDRMREEGLVTPNEQTFAAALKACASCAAATKEDHTKLKYLKKGREIHLQARTTGCEMESFVASTLVDMYAKSGSLEEAREVFDKMVDRSVVSWNAILFGYAESGQPEESLKLFARMRDRDALSFVAALKACSSCVERGDDRGALAEMGRSIHSQAAELELDSRTPVANALITMYAKFGTLDDAWNVFDRLEERDKLSWTLVISALSESGQSEDALWLFRRMEDEGFTPDARALTAAIKACGKYAEEEESKQVALVEGKTLHSQAEKLGLEMDIFVASTLMDMYLKCESSSDAIRISDTMIFRDVVTWNLIITAYAQSENKMQRAFDTFSQMQDEGFEPNDRTYVALLKACGNFAVKEQTRQDMHWLKKGKKLHSQAAQSGYGLDLFVTSSLVDVYAKHRAMNEAKMMFETMTLRSAVTWNTMILGYTENGEGELALILFQQLQNEGTIQPSALTYIAALKACGSIASLEAGKKIYKQILRAGLEENGAVLDRLLEFYGVCGSITEAKRIFQSIPHKRRGVWNALISGYARQGNYREVFTLLKEMEDESDEKRTTADEATYLSVLSVCSHAGLVEKGTMFFKKMKTNGITPSIKHYGCMVDLLCRANHSNEAEKVLRSMPFEPNLEMWTTLLGSCPRSTNLELKKMAFEAAMKFDDKNSAAFVLIANAYTTLNFDHTQNDSLLQVSAVAQRPFEAALL